MILEMKVPSPGESITEVEIASWLVADGDYVEKDQAIAEVDSDKATLELPAEASGIITLKAAEGDAVAVGDVVCLIDTDAKKPSSAGDTKEDSKGESKGDTKEVLKEDSKENELPEKEDSKAPETFTKGDEGSNDNSEKELAKEQEETPNTDNHEKAPNPDKGTYASGVASPAAKKILTEKNMSASAIKGTGKDGRITKEDAVSATPSMGTPTGGKRGTSRSKMSMLRRKVAERLVEAKNTTAMLTTFNEVDMSPIFAIREEFKETFKNKHGVGLGFMSFFTMAVVRALKMYPAVNSMIDGQEMISYDFCDISIAVSGPKGLMVPVIRNAENLSFRGVEEEVKRLAIRARDGQITVDEMTGGTFTISNGGVFGSMLSTPIINPPQSAILGMHNIVERPVAVDGHVEIRPIMFVALSYDHRIIDGKESVGFLVAVKEALETPTELLMDNDVKRALEL